MTDEQIDAMALQCYEEMDHVSGDDDVKVIASFLRQAASAAPAQEPAIDDLARQMIRDLGTHGISITRIDPADFFSAPVASAAPVVPEDQEATFEVVQDGMVVAAASGPRKDALREAQHYAAVYGQDGPVKIREKTRPRAKKGVL